MSELELKTTGDAVDQIPYPRVVCQMRMGMQKAIAGVKAAAAQPIRGQMFTTSPMLAAAVCVGVLLLVSITWTVVGAVCMRRRRREDVSLARCWGLIAEAVAARERVAGQIDTATYQKRMGDLARSTVGETSRARRSH